MSNNIKHSFFFSPLMMGTLLFLCWSQIQATFFNNGFDLSDSLINRSEIHHGGPVKDGIPSIDHPHFIQPKEAHFLKKTDRVLGISINGVSKAYPIKILNYHEIVNDHQMVISYCPLCASGVAYSANIKGEYLHFGVSGLLYNSDVLLYDRKTQSLWSQLLAKAITGDFKGTKLKRLYLENSRWDSWLIAHPNTLVLSTDTGYQRNYQHSPYQGYANSRQLFFPVSHLDKRYHPKEWVLGIEVQGIFKVYPFAELSKVKSPLRETIQGQKITLYFDAEKRIGQFLDQQQKPLISTTSFWFAWMAFHPNSLVFTGSVK